MNESEYQQLRETAWRRALTDDEEARRQAHLAARPEAEADWEADAALTQLLGQVPDVPVPSNFTALVLQALERDEAAARPASLAARLGDLLRRFGPRLAWASVVLAVAWLGYHQHRIHTRDQMAQGLLRFTEAAGLKDPAVFKDFEAILRLSQMPPPADVELAVALHDVSP